MTKPGRDIVVHLAAKVGRHRLQSGNPASLFYDNLMMGVQLIHEGYLRRIEKFVAIGTICAYPKIHAVPFKEEKSLEWYPEETKCPLPAWQRRWMPWCNRRPIVSSMASIQSFFCPLIFTDPAITSIPAHPMSFLHLIKKCADAIENHAEEITVWGTGQATRGIFFVEEPPEAIVLATESYNKSGARQYRTGFEISIKDCALIAELTDFKGKNNMGPDETRRSATGGCWIPPEPFRNSVSRPKRASGRLKKRRSTGYALIVITN